MIKVVGVRFRTAGKIYYFDPQKFPIKKGDHVIVETARGVEYGTVVGGMKEVADDVEMVKFLWIMECFSKMLRRDSMFQSTSLSLL